MYSQNAKGHSSPVTIYSFTIKEAEKHIAGSAHPANVTRYNLEEEMSFFGGGLGPNFAGFFKN